MKKPDPREKRQKGKGKGRYLPERLGRERLRRHLRGQKGRLAFGLCCLLLRHGFSLSIPWSLRYAIEGLKATPDLHRVKLYALWIIGAALGQGFFRYLYRMSLVDAGFGIERALREELLAHLQRLPASFYARARTGDLLSRATHDLEGVKAFVGVGLMSLFFTAVVYLSTLPLLVWIAPLLTLYSLAAYPLVLILVKRRGRLLFRQSLHAQQQFSSLNALVQENLRGADMIRAYLLEERATAGFARASQGYLEANLALARSRVWLSSLMYAAIGVGMAVAFWKGGEAVIQGNMSLGSFVAFNFYLAMLIFPTLELGMTSNVLQRGLASMARIEELFQEKAPDRQEETEDQGPRSQNPPSALSDCSLTVPLRGEVALEGVGLLHPTGRDGGRARLLLRGIDLRIRQGQKLGIMGPVGSGKSLLAALVCGLLPASEGRLRIDGHPIDRLPRPTLRRAIGYVPQEPFLFSGSILENIAFGLEETDPERVTWAARVAQLWGEIEGWPLGLETRIGERGIRLSGGQRQRLALARALAPDPPILILDDPFSQVDLLTEERILEGLLPWLEGKTCLLISSRVSSLRGMDRVAVLVEGRIVEEGRPTDLLRQGGVYAGIYRRQQLQRELEGL